MPCDLCASVGGMLVFQHAQWRVVRALDAPGFPAFYRVIWQSHVTEFSDLGPDDRAACMEAVATAERVLRDQLSPTKINIASLGNVVPHLHWHVIARFDGDSHFPQPIWGTPQRAPVADALERLGMSLPALDEAVRAALAAVASD